MSASPTTLRVVRSATPRAELESLRNRLHRMQAEPVRQPVATPDVVRSLIEMRTGGAYRVDDQSLAIALLSATSAEGSWVGVVGVDDLGLEAAVEAGLDLARAVIVPEPGECWLEAVSALVDVLPVVLLRPPRRVDQRLAAKVSARLRKRSATLFVQGNWPGAEARLWLEQTRWSGVGDGSGRLRERSAQVGCRRGTAPAQFADWPPLVEAPLDTSRERAG
jgi:hypothetical protein